MLNNRKSAFGWKKRKNKYYRLIIVLFYGGPSTPNKKNEQLKINNHFF